MSYRENLIKVQSIFENNSLNSIKKKINESSLLGDALREELQLLSDEISAGNYSVVTPQQMTMLLDTIEGMEIVNAVKDYNSAITVLRLILSDLEFLSVNFEALSEDCIDDINTMLLNEKINTIKDFETRGISAELKATVIEILKDNEAWNYDIVGDIDMANFKRSLVAESDSSLQSKIELINAMSSTELTLAYTSILGLQPTDDYTMRSAIIQDVTDHPYGKMSKTLEPLSQDEWNNMQSQYSNGSPAGYDEFWKSLEEKYGILECYRKMLKYNFPVLECMRLMTDDKTYHLSRMNNGRLCVVGGINNEYLRLI